MSKAKLRCNAVTKEITPEKAFKAMYGSIENFIQELRSEKYNKLNSRTTVFNETSKEQDEAVTV